MDDIFTHAETIDCPECTPWGPRNRRHHLIVQSTNYSGSGQDMGVCPECGKSWRIKYKIDEMFRESSWDESSRIEREGEEANKKEAEEALEELRELAEYKRLKEKFKGEEEK